MLYQIRNTQDLVNQARRQSLIALDSYFTPFAGINLRSALPDLRQQGQWAITPDLCQLLITLVTENKPRVVVELGSGTSTVIIGAALREEGAGILYSFDHSEMWAKNTREAVKRHQLEGVVTVIDAPLEKLGTQIWYQVSAFGELSEVDLLFIDGPPASINANARGPALEILYDKLSPNAVIVLDDSYRMDEQGIVEKWLRIFPDLESSFIPTEKGTYILRRKKTI